MTLALRYAVRSDVGLLREGNEDSAYAGPHLLAVADGMGGHAAGEVASAATITTIAPLDAEDPGPDLVSALADAVARFCSIESKWSGSSPCRRSSGGAEYALTQRSRDSRSKAVSQSADFEWKSQARNSRSRPTTSSSGNSGM